MSDSIFGKMVHRYTRAQAIEDSVLVEISEAAQEVGFRIPVAMTATVWARCVAWQGEEAGQDERGRLWDVLWIARLATRAAKERSQVGFTLRVIQAGEAVEHVALRLAIGAGDTGEPVITILMSNED